MQTQARTFRILTLTAAVCLATNFASATTTNTWSGGGGVGDKSWGNSANWSDGALTGDALALFTSLTVAGTIGPSGTPNSIVDSDQTIQGLFFQNTNSAAGLGHTIQISSGVSLTVTGSLPRRIVLGCGLNSR